MLKVPVHVQNIGCEDINYFYYKNQAGTKLIYYWFLSITLGGVELTFSAMIFERIWNFMERVFGLH